MTWRWLSLTVLSVALAGCSATGDSDSLGGSPLFRVPGCEAIEHAACNVLDSGCQKRLLTLAACLRGDEPGTLPAVTVMTEQDFADYLNDLIAQDPPPDPNHYERALTMLGLVEPGAFSPTTVVADNVKQYWGLYRHATDDIILIDHGIAADAESASNVLVHEFVHALQDRDVDLAAYADEHATSYDSLLASDSVTEGEARLHQARHWASLLGLNPADIDWHKRFRESVELGEAWVLEQPSPYSATYSEFPYAWGARYMHFAWDAGGLMGVLERFASPPRTTHTLMTSELGIVTSEVVPTLVAAPTPPAAWKPFAENTLGAWGVFLAFARVTTPEAARATALTWRGDGLWVYYYMNTGETAVVWRIDFADDASAAAAAQLADALPRPPAVYQQSQQQGVRVVLAATSQFSVPLDWAFSP